MLGVRGSSLLPVRSREPGFQPVTNPEPSSNEPGQLNCGKDRRGEERCELTMSDHKRVTFKNSLQDSTALCLLADFFCDPGAAPQTSKLHLPPNFISLKNYQLIVNSMRFASKDL